MKVSIDHNLKWYDKVWAALIFFTRLPFWRIYQPPKTAYETVVEHWPLTGWLTGGIMALTLYGCSFIMPYMAAVIVAVIVRLLITGALHEDGLADFMDGFGAGGRDRERILEIMKDSRIGSYGVLGLVFYALLLTACLHSLPPVIGALAIFAGDTYAKMLAAQIVQILPYARSSETAKNGVVYRKFNIPAGISLFIQGILPLALLLYYLNFMKWDLLVFVPCLVMYALYRLLWSRIKGYTGDCCGAIFLLIELSFYLTLNIILHTI